MCYVTAQSHAVPQAVKNEGNDSEMNYLLLNRSFEHDYSISERVSFRVQTEKHTADPYRKVCCFRVITGRS